MRIFWIIRVEKKGALYNLLMLLEMLFIPKSDQKQLKPNVHQKTTIWFLIILIMNLLHLLQLILPKILPDLH